ncbi:hypothetical protein ACFQZ4_16720 [Catellatospora coxensis]|uniref:LigA protein n=1 Tax=Catellatospora coxensis TaxID=310354 RepID=A0A8J3L3J6_9ACTN|nr:hypothetical protein [Catellatospora coxensis]GIG07926.1 hypothetical protein Cco03nite_46260 [Catellatospora coxensis]
MQNGGRDLVAVHVESSWAAGGGWLNVDHDGSIEGTAERVFLVGSQPSDCAGQVCYRVAPGLLRVESGGDATGWTTAWEITGTDYEQLAAEYPALGDRAEHLSSRSVVVREVAGGHVVFVANGRDGLLYRSVDGVWHRLGIPMGGEGWHFEEPPRLASEPPPADPSWIVALLVAAMLGVAGLLMMAVRRMWRGRDVRLTAGAAVGGGLLSYGACQVPGAGMFPSAMYATMLITMIVIAALVVLLLGVGKGVPLRR